MGRGAAARRQRRAAARGARSTDRRYGRKFILTAVEHGDPEARWLIDGMPFNPLIPLARVPQGSAELWTFVNEGNWIDPLHIHQESTASSAVTA